MRAVLALCLFLLTACVPQAQADQWLHGRTEPPTAGVVVTVSWGGAPRSSTTNAGGAWGLTPGSGMHTLTVTPPAGYTVTRITHPVLGSATGNVLQASITASTNLNADVVVYLAPIPTPPSTATPETTATPTVTPSHTPLPTLPMPPVTPPLPTPKPLPTPPPGGWREWTDPPDNLVTALRLEWQWIGSQYEQARTDPLWMAAADRGPCWAITTPVITHYEIESPDGSIIETTLRWQLFVTPKGWRGVLATPDDPYRVAVIEIAW